jgi:hypothetical protein
MSLTSLHKIRTNEEMEFARNAAAQKTVFGNVRNALHADELGFRCPSDAIILPDTKLAGKRNRRAHAHVGPRVGAHVHRNRDLA